MKWFRGKPRVAASEASRRSRGTWLDRIFGGRKIDNLIDENFPSWEEYSAQKAKEVEEAKAAQKFELPPYKVSISSPLQRNFLYALVVGGAIGMGYAVPGWASVLLYGAIIGAFVIALFLIVRDGIFLHLEGHRLQVDGVWINEHTHGPGEEENDKDENSFLKTFTRKKKTIFRSRLLQIHYQNVLRAFEQGARRAWVYQDASIAEIQTLLTQGGQKVVWTIIEVLPQLGLLGTLVGLMAMFTAFRSSVGAPEISIISGFGTALGTTIFANLFVLILRPLHMQNERAMHEILSTLQTLMAVFILPTQQYAMERSLGRGVQAGAPLAPSVAAPLLTGGGEQRIQRSLEQLAGTMREFVNLQEKVDSGSVARETARIALEVQSALRAFQESVNPDHLAMQQRAFGKLTESVQDLAAKLGSYEKLSAQAAARPAADHSERIEHDLTQLRVLTRDTLVLLEQIASRLNTDSRDPSRNMLSLKFGVHAQVFPESEGAGTVHTVQAEPVAPPAERAPSPPPRIPTSRTEALRQEPVEAVDVTPVERERPERIARSERTERPGRPDVTPPKIRLARDRS